MILLKFLGAVMSGGLAHYGVRRRVDLRGPREKLKNLNKTGCVICDKSDQLDIFHL